MAKLKRILAILLIIIAFPVALFFAACAKGSEPPPEKGNVLPDGQTDDEEPELLEGYDISGVRLSAETGKADIDYGNVSFEAMQYTDGDFSMKYRVHVPEVTENAPVVMFFHGAGERGSDNSAQITTYNGIKTAIENSDRLEDAFIIAPQCPGTAGNSSPSVGMKWVNVNSWSDCQYSTTEIAESEPLEAALKLLKTYDGLYDIDNDRIYATGLSMGGYATWDIAVRHPELLAAAAPICGGCDTSKWEELTDTAIYAFHGLSDTTVPPTGTLKMYSHLYSYGNMEFVRYEGAGHGIWNDALSSKGLEGGKDLFDDCLFAHSRDEKD